MDFEPVKKINVHNKGKAIFILLTLIMCLGVSFSAATFVKNRADDRNNEINSGLVTIDFTEDNTENVTIDNAVPVTDDVGIKNKPYSFNLQNTSSVPINAKIELNVDRSITTMPLTSVKYALYVDDGLIKSSTLDTLTGNLLHEINNMEPNADPVKVKIVFWIDHDYESDGGEKFSAKIGATGESIDVIPE